MAAPLVHQVNVKATPETIYRAISTAGGLQAFWTSDSKAEPKVGSIASFGFGGPTQRMRIDELVPGKRVKWTGLNDFPNWDKTTVSWDIAAAEKGETSVTFRHADWPATVSQDDLGSINYTWGLVVERLKQYAESGKPNPLFAFATR
ncbi:MAG: SRPBCC domain-containing protein [Chloroflexi bacterium]|nr:MAG: SRPBCC domain-containing protein [Chloroflexota bacterium]